MNYLNKTNLSFLHSSLPPPHTHLYPLIGNFMFIVHFEWKQNQLDACRGRKWYNRGAKDSPCWCPKKQAGRVPLGKPKSDSSSQHLPHIPLQWFPVESQILSPPTVRPPHNRPIALGLQLREVDCIPRACSSWSMFLPDWSTASGLQDCAS